MLQARLDYGVTKRYVGVIGATSLVGESLLSLLVESGAEVVAFSQNVRGDAIYNGNGAKGEHIEWRKLGDFQRLGCSSNNICAEQQRTIETWICLAPIWVLPEHFSMLKTFGAKRVIALSSTSRITKATSSDKDEQKLAARMADAEEELSNWAEKEQVAWTILQPTLIYGLGKDRNICELASFIHRFGFYPLCGPTRGLRQPIHLEDVANACYLVLNSDSAINRTYIISGGEVLPYREMVGRIFEAMGKRPRFFRVPLFLFRPVISVLRCFPRFNDWSVSMVERMNKDMAFEHSEAEHDFGFAPRKFQISKQDLPA